MPMSTYLADKVLDHAFGGPLFSPPSVYYMQIHVGAPGSSGLNNIAAGPPARQQIATWNAASTQQKTNLTAIVFPTIVATETITHYSIWDASTAGNCLHVGTVTPNRNVTAGVQVVFASGAVVLVGVT